jgi:hypothetical protein
MNSFDCMLLRASRLRPSATFPARRGVASTSGSTRWRLKRFPRSTVG